MKKLLFSAACLLTGILFIASVAAGQQVVQSSDDFQTPEVSSLLAPPAVQLRSVVSGVSRPIYVTHARDKRLFIVQQDGRVLILQNGALLPAPFLDIVSLANCCGERGLIGLAFHPNYPSTPYVFAHFTSNGAALPDGTTPASGDNVIVRFNASGNAVNVGSGKTLLVIPQPFSNHNGGTIEFGGDGFLYIGKGDGGSGNDPGNRAQNINLLLGKILRIDVNQNVNTPPFYGIPPTNPFAGATPGADEIFLVGLRNPFRFSFDRANGDLWIGDVGQSAREEIDRLPINASAPGKNLGWRIYEGTFCTGLDPCVPPANYLPPVAEYSHSSGRCSITGGYVYRGTQIPALVGSYVYADYCTGEIFRLVGATAELMLDTTHNIASFGEDSTGELFVVALSGQILRLIATPPTAAVISGRVLNNESQGIAGVTVTLSGGNLTQPLVVTTNASGFYQFPEVEVGQAYTITPTSPGRSFSPPTQFFTVLGNVPDVDFYTKR